MARALAVLSGAGHVMMGYTVRGIAFLLMTASLLASVVLWRGVAREPLAIHGGVSFLRVALTALLLLGVYALCVRDLLARQRAEEGG